MNRMLGFSGLALACTVALAASADYYLKIEGVSGDASSGQVYLKVASTGDLDGDGMADEAILRLRCDGPTLVSAALQHNVKSPRDAASGMASGKRTHHPVTFVKEWGATTPQLSRARPAVTVKPGTRADAQGWLPVQLSSPGSLCNDAGKASSAPPRQGHAQS